MSHSSGEGLARPVAGLHLPFLDGVRGVAILGVFLFHALVTAYESSHLPWSGWFRDFDVPLSFLILSPLTYGSAGVAVFFAVSGFCIHLSHMRSRKKSWMEFFVRRFFRIYPPYLLAIFVFSFVWPWGAFELPGLGMIKRIGIHALAIHNFSKETFFAINPSFWSIAVEIQLYAIYPLLLLLAYRLGWRRCLILVGLAEILIRMTETALAIWSDFELPFLLVHSPFAYWLSWSLGAYLAECFLSGKASRLFRVPLWIPACCALLFPLCKPSAPFTFLAFAWLSAASIHSLFNGGLKFSRVSDAPVGRFLGSHLGLLGKVSFSFYLIHQPILIAWNRFLPDLLRVGSVEPLTGFFFCVFLYPLVLFLSILSYRFVEQPSIALGKRALPFLESLPVPFLPRARDGCDAG